MAVLRKRVGGHGYVGRQGGRGRRPALVGIGHGTTLRYADRAPLAVRVSNESYATTQSPWRATHGPSHDCHSCSTVARSAIDGSLGRASATASGNVAYGSMHHFRLRSLRGLSALVITLSFGLLTTESMLADVHDGDATHEELTRIEGAARHNATHVAHGDREGGSMNHADDHPGERAPDDAGHDRHTCHHAHVHSGWFHKDEALNGCASAEHESPIALRKRIPASWDAQPQLRPPIG